jgi:hypothetical protein
MFLSYFLCSLVFCQLGLDAVPLAPFRRPPRLFALWVSLAFAGRFFLALAGLLLARLPLPGFWSVALVPRLALPRGSAFWRSSFHRALLTNVGLIWGRLVVL